MAGAKSDIASAYIARTSHRPTTPMGLVFAIELSHQSALPTGRTFPGLGPASLRPLGYRLACDIAELPHRSVTPCVTFDCPPTPYTERRPSHAVGRRRYMRVLFRELTSFNARLRPGSRCARGPSRLRQTDSHGAQASITRFRSVSFSGGSSGRVQAWSAFPCRLAPEVWMASTGNFRRFERFALGLVAGSSSAASADLWLGIALVLVGAVAMILPRLRIPPCWTGYFWRA